MSSSHLYIPYAEFIRQHTYILEKMKTSRVIDMSQRVSYMKDYIMGKKVLNIGCLNHSLVGYNKQHDEFRDLNPSLLVGVDILEDAKNIGNNIEIGDINDPKFVDSLREKYGTFDLVFAGELIEHLPNYTLFFDNTYSLLNDNGVVAISTPNPFGLHYFVQNLLYRYIPNGNSDHIGRIDAVELCFNLQNNYKLDKFVRASSKNKEYYLCKFLGLSHLSMNYLAIFNKNTTPGL